MECCHVGWMLGLSQHNLLGGTFVIPQVDQEIAVTYCNPVEEITVLEIRIAQDRIQYWGFWEDGRQDQGDT
jgi:hypothetical protein